MEPHLSAANDRRGEVRYAWQCPHSGSGLPFRAAIFEAIGEQAQRESGRLEARLGFGCTTGQNAREFAHLADPPYLRFTVYFDSEQFPWSN